MTFFSISITPTLPGVLPVRVRKVRASPHTLSFLHNFKRHISSGLNAAHVFNISAK
jgi:hypothetical protein